MQTLSLPVDQIRELARQEMIRRGLLIERIDAEVMPAHFHAGQADVWNDEVAIDLVACAGVQGGKTEIDAYWLLREIQRTAKYADHLPTKRAVYLFVGPTLELLTSQAIPAFEALFVFKHKLGRLIKGTKPKFIFSPEGAKRLCGLDIPITVVFGYANDSSNLESVTALAGVWDEAGQSANKLASFRAYNSRLVVARTMGERLGVVLGRRLFTTTPYEWGWFKDQLVDQSEKSGGRIALFNWPSWYNPNVSEAVCRAELDKMPREEWEMRYLGLFTIPRGKIYDCFDYKRNTTRRFELPDDWVRYIGVDFGSNNTAAVMLAYNGETAYLYRTYVGGSKTVKEKAADIIAGLPMKPVCAGGSHQEDETRQAYAAHGLWIREPYVLGVEDQIALVYAAIKTGRLVIFDDMSSILAEIEQYSRELDAEGNPTKAIKDKAKYHRLDALRYICTILFPAGDPLQGARKVSRFDDTLARVI